MRRITKIRYSYVWSRIYEFIKEFNINTLPVNPYQIIRQNKWTLRTYSFYAKKEKITIKDIIDAYGSKDAYTIFQNGRYSIAFNDRIRSKGRICFTLMHEIGHIYLKHLEEFEQTILTRGGLSEKEYNILEAEANIFASEILTPYEVLISLNWTDYKTIKKQCGLSDKAAKTRASQLFDMLLNNIYIDSNSPIMSNFHDFIYKRHCPTCGYSCISNKFVYCPICGEKLKWGDGNMKYDDGYELDKNGRVLECPICGNEEVGKDENEQYCIICGTYLVNKCTHDYDEYNNFGELINPACGKIVPGNARFCPYCGSETTFYKNKLLLPWKEAKKQILKRQEENKNENDIFGDGFVSIDEVPF